MRETHVVAFCYHIVLSDSSEMKDFLQENKSVICILNKQLKALNEMLHFKGGRGVVASYLHIF